MQQVVAKKLYIINTLTPTSSGDSKRKEKK